MDAEGGKRTCRRGGELGESRRVESFPVHMSTMEDD